MDQDTYQYLEAQILTAPPQKLRLLLIEGALRCAHQALEKWDRAEDGELNLLLSRCRGIISELLSGVRTDESRLTRQVAAIYLFLFRTVTEAQLQRDRTKVKEAIRVLDVERETWQLLCAQTPSIPVPHGGHTPGPALPGEIVAPLEGIGGPLASSFNWDA